VAAVVAEAADAAGKRDKLSCGADGWVRPLRSFKKGPFIQGAPARASESAAAFLAARVRAVFCGAESGRAESSSGRCVRWPRAAATFPFA